MTTVFDLMPQVMDWLAANDIEPTDFPIAAVPEISDGQITCPVFLRNERGNKYLDEDGKVARSTVTVPLKVEPPAVLADWLAGRVPPSGDGATGREAG